MAVMDAAIFEALWRHTAQIKYAKRNYLGVPRIILLQIFIYLIHFPQNKQNLREEQPL